MCRFVLPVLVLVLALSHVSIAQQLFRLPDVSSMKHVTTRQSDHAADIPGNETTMDYYAGPGGQMTTIYSYRGRKVAFSTHSNHDIQGTYRIFMDQTGNGLFQEINKGVLWQLPAWAR
jgi:hypothetical protein